MASSKEYLDFVLEQLSELDDISYRAMMMEVLDKNEEYKQIHFPYTAA